MMQIKVSLYLTSFTPSEEEYKSVRFIYSRSQNKMTGVAQSDYATGWTFGVGFPTGTGRDFFSSPPRPDRLWCSSSLLSGGYRRPFPWG